MGSSARTLILSRGYEPMEIVHWSRAMVLLLSGKAKVLEEHKHEVVRSATREFRVPLVVVRSVSLFKRDRPVRYSPLNVMARDGFECCYCGFKARRVDQLTMDHVLPSSRGGKTRWENIVASCYGCNQQKGNRTPEEAGMPMRFRPHRPRWTPAIVLQLSRQPMPEMWKPYLGLG